MSENTDDTTTPSEIDLEQLGEAMDLMGGFLAENPDIAATIRYDLHAIRNGDDTLGQYDFPTWLTIKTLLGDITEEQLTDVIGPAGTPGRSIKLGPTPR